MSRLFQGERRDINLTKTPIPLLGPSFSGHYHAESALLRSLETILALDVNLMAVQRVMLSDHVLLPEMDRPVLAAAIALNCQILVTGDSSHFSNLFGVSFEGTAVLSSRMTAELLLAGDV